MEFSKVLKQRHAVRRFTDCQIKREILFEILNDARMAPSWANAQERRVYVAMRDTAHNIRKAYAEQAKKGLIGLSDFSCTHREYWSKESQHNMAEFEHSIENYLGEDYKEFLIVQDELYNAPTLIFLTLPKIASSYSVLDLGAFEMALVLSATEHGLDSIVSYASVKYPEILRKYLPVSDDENIVIGIGLGYRDENAKINQFRSTRVSMSQFLTIKE